MCHVLEVCSQNCINQLSLTEKEAFQHLCVGRVVCVCRVCRVCRRRVCVSRRVSRRVCVVCVCVCVCVCENCINQLSLTEKEAFQHMWACNIFICLFALTLN